jgi:hypothetical protein
MVTKQTGRTAKGHRTLRTRARKTIPESKFAFPKQRKEPLTDAEHVKNALARFDQVRGVTSEERKRAFERIKRAAAKYGVDVKERTWRDLGERPHTRNAARRKDKSS